MVLNVTLQFNNIEGFPFKITKSACTSGINRSSFKLLLFLFEIIGAHRYTPCIDISEKPIGEIFINAYNFIIIIFANKL